VLEVSATVVGAIAPPGGSTTGQDLFGFDAGDPNAPQSEYRVVSIRGSGKAA